MFKNFEIIYVNDSSTDKTLDILKYFEKMIKKLIFLKKKILEWNVEKKKSKWEYLKILNFDDIFE